MSVNASSPIKSKVTLPPRTTVESTGSTMGPLSPKYSIVGGSCGWTDGKLARRRSPDACLPAEPTRRFGRLPEPNRSVEGNHFRSSSDDSAGGCGRAGEKL